MDKYIAKWSANNSTYGTFTGNNLAKMRKEAREIAKGNTFAGSSGNWSIDLNDGEPQQEHIAEGRV
jgi:hypothetical protein